MRRQLQIASRVIFISLASFASLTQANGVRPRVIYGDDDRLDYYQVDTMWKSKADSTVALIRAAKLDTQGPVTNIKTDPYGQSMGLCPEEPFYEQETAAFCSGFLVAPNVVVTAGHCIRNQKQCDETKFVFGFKIDAAASKPRSVESNRVFGCNQLLASVVNATGEDFAVATLDRNVDFAKPLTFRNNGAPNAGNGLKVIGHPSGLPLKVAGGAAVRSVAGEFLIANLDTYGGNSGSAVFNETTGDVEGVLVRGEMDFLYKNGCRVSNRCDVTACRGEDVTLFERVLPHLPK